MSWREVFDNNIGSYFKIIIKYLNEDCYSSKKKVEDCIQPIRLNIKGKLQTRQYNSAGKYPIIDQGKKFIVGYIDDEAYVLKNISPVVVFGDHTRNVKYVDFDFALGADGVKLLKPYKVLDARFLYYQMFSFDFEEKGYSRYNKQLSEKEVVIPFHKNEKQSLIYQKRIVDFFEALRENQVVDTYFDKEIEKDIYRLQQSCVSLFSLINNIIPEQQTYLQLLRQTILQEAVQGKLTKQASSPSKGEVSRSDGGVDQPATELLKRIKAEKERLLKAGKLKKEKELPPITEDEIPFELPEGWVWCRLGDVVLKSEAGKSLVCDRRPVEESEWGIIKVSAMSWGSFDEHENKALPKGIKPFVEYKIEEGDYLISRANTEELIGKSVIVGELKLNLLLSDKSIRIFFSDDVSKHYINFFNNSTIAREYYKRVASGTSDSMKNITREQMYMLPFPLPPLAEQQRIVAKVQQVQQQLSQLETQVQQSRQYAQQLLQSVLEEAFEHKGKVYKMKEEQVSMVAED